MISEQLIRSVSGEEQADRIYKVDLSNRLITSISNLKAFGKLRYLRLDFNRLRCIENLQFVPDLRELHLQNNEITHLDGLKNNKALTVLNLSNNYIEKISNISHLIKLETFLIDDNKLEKVQGLQFLKCLKILSISNNKLTSIDSMPTFSKLQSLNISKNKIAKITATVFESCSKLTYLNIEQNRLKNVSFLGSLVCLEHLNLQKNEIAEFPKVILRNLQYLNINSNNLQNLPKICECFPQLSQFLFSKNYICSDYQVIESVAEADSLSTIDFRQNPMHTSEFQNTLFHIYKFDTINEKQFNNPGSRYMNQANEIQKDLRNYLEIEDDEEDRKIKMSGFYDDILEEQISGSVPNRPNSPSKKKTIMKINEKEIEKSYHEIMDGEKRIEQLRQECQNIFKRNNIITQISQKEEEKESELIIMTEIKPESNKVLGPSELIKSNEQEMNRWKQLKAKQKNFNIRGVVRKLSQSRKKVAGKAGSVSKTSNQQRTELMRTQVQPPRWNGDPNLMRTMNRPISARKKKQI